MKSKRYNNSFTSSSMVKEEGRTAYYKLLDSVRDGDAVRIKRGVYATAEQLADTMIDVEAIGSRRSAMPFLRMECAWAHHLIASGIPCGGKKRSQNHASNISQDRAPSYHRHDV